jgi:hypothetical protein
MKKFNFLIMAVFPIIFLLLLIPGTIVSAFAVVDDFTTDKSLYHDGDKLTVSGNVSYDPDIPFVTIQIFTPGKSNFADFNTFAVSPDGSFSSIFNVGGPTWTSDGFYSIKITYDGNLEKSIEYQEITEIETTQSENTPSEPTPEIEEPHTITPDILEPISNFSTLKLQIPNFPALDKSPQYYIDRYNAESSYKYWFDSQFPNESIYNVLGYGDPISVPSWIRNNAHWWSQDLISEDEFINSLEYLIQEGIIKIK